MKALVIRMLHFRLPEDFKGDVAEALAAASDYLSQVTTSHKPLTKKELELKITSDKRLRALGSLSMDNASSELFDEFIEHVSRGKCLVGQLGVVEYDPCVEYEDKHGLS